VFGCYPLTVFLFDLPLLFLYDHRFFFLFAPTFLLFVLLRFGLIF
jgi:hypothetical protein